MDDNLDQQLSGIAGLGDPVRRALYRFVAEQGEAVGRDEAANAVGIARPLAAYHLDKLVDDGLLVARYERRSGRRGPGAGRPAKLYVRSGRQIELSLPARDYALVAELLARAVEADPTGAAQAGLQGAARALGADLGAEATRLAEGPDALSAPEATMGSETPGLSDGPEPLSAPESAVSPESPEPSGGSEALRASEPTLSPETPEPSGGPDALGAAEDAGRASLTAAVQAVLASRGYEPSSGTDGVIRLRNCPFDRLAAGHRELVCGANLAMLQGLVDGLGGEHPLRAALDPQPGRCCVVLTAAS